MSALLKIIELTGLNRIVSMYLDYAELQANNRKLMYMKDWIQRLDSILRLNGRELLTHAGKISHELAVEKSELELEKYRIAQKEIEKEQSLKELEADIKKLKKNN